MSRALLLVFVVDSSEPKRFPEAKDHLHELLTFDPCLPVMLLANKQVNNRTTVFTLCCLFGKMLIKFFYSSSKMESLNFICLYFFKVRCDRIKPFQKQNGPLKVQNFLVYVGLKSTFCPLPKNTSFL